MRKVNAIVMPFTSDEDIGEDAQYRLLQRSFRWYSLSAKNPVHELFAFSYRSITGKMTVKVRLHMTRKNISDLF